MRYFLSSFLLLIGVVTSAQIPSLSPEGALLQQVGNTHVTVDYDRPSARGRSIFGSLVPYGKVWRTGAGYCTKVGFDRPVKVGGQPIPAGKYSLFTIPGPEEWMIIFNADTSLYGSRDYDTAADVARFRVPAGQSDRYLESLTIDLDVVMDNARLSLGWGRVRVDFLIETSTAEEVAAYIEELLTHPTNAVHDYVWPAEYLLMQRRDLSLAEYLINKQLALEESEYAWRIAMELYDYQGYSERALEAVRRAIAYRKANPLDEQNQAWSLGFWKNELARRQKKKD